MTGGMDGSGELVTLSLPPPTVYTSTDSSSCAATAVLLFAGQRRFLKARRQRKARREEDGVSELNFRRLQYRGMKSNCSISGDTLRINSMCHIMVRSGKYGLQCFN